MNLSFEQALAEVWRQSLVENSKSVRLGAENDHDADAKGIRERTRVVKILARLEMA